jgi:SAM-dependent methyltransferase
MSMHAASPWRCPTCRGALHAEGATALRCPACDRRHAVVEGIPDFRVTGDAWVDWQHDQEDARRLAHDMRDRPLEALVRRVFEEQPGRTPEDIALRTQQVLAAPERLLRADLAGWLRPATRSGTFLDLGCGPGMLLAAAARAGGTGIGLDVSMVWLVVAQRLIAHHGGVPVLAAGFGEALPLASDAVDAVVSLDVIEHVGDQAAYLREIDRVTRPGGRIALSTPNRFSLAPEPHVGVWGVGWLPRPLQRRYAEWRSGKSYAFTRLVSTWEARRLLRRHTRFHTRLLAPSIPAEELDRGSPLRRRATRAYNALASLGAARPLLLSVGAYYQVVGEKRAP